MQILKKSNLLFNRSPESLTSVYSSVPDSPPEVLLSDNNLGDVAAMNGLHLETYLTGPTTEEGTTNITTADHYRKRNVTEEKYKIQHPDGRVEERVIRNINTIEADGYRKEVKSDKTTTHQPNAVLSYVNFDLYPKSEDRICRTGALVYPPARILKLLGAFLNFPELGMKVRPVTSLRNLKLSGAAPSIHLSDPTLSDINEAQKKGKIVGYFPEVDPYSKKGRSQALRLATGNFNTE